MASEFFQFFLCTILYTVTRNAPDVLLNFVNPCFLSFYHIQSIGPFWSLIFILVCSKHFFTLFLENFDTKYKKHCFRSFLRKN